MDGIVNFGVNPFFKSYWNKPDPPPVADKPGMHHVLVPGSDRYIDIPVEYDLVPGGYLRQSESRTDPLGNVTRPFHSWDGTDVTAPWFIRPVVPGGSYPSIGNSTVSDVDGLAGLGVDPVKVSYPVNKRPIVEEDTPSRGSPPIRDSTPNNVRLTFDGSERRRPSSRRRLFVPEVYGSPGGGNRVRWNTYVDRGVRSLTRRRVYGGGGSPPPPGGGSGLEVVRGRRRKRWMLYPLGAAAVGYGVKRMYDKYPLFRAAVNLVPKVRFTALGYKPDIYVPPVKLIEWKPSESLDRVRAMKRKAVKAIDGKRDYAVRVISLDDDVVGMDLDSPRLRTPRVRDVVMGEREADYSGCLYRCRRGRRACKKRRIYS